jgi:threonine/homoserine efflux transporter RhtA
MDFIERWFGLSPDGGDGTTELWYIIALGAVIVAVFWRPVYRRYIKPKQNL